MNKDLKKTLYVFLFLAITLLSLAYVRELLSFLNFQYDYLLSKFIIISGFILISLLLTVLAYAKIKHYDVSLKSVNDKKITVLLVIAIIMALGLNFI